MEVGEAHIITWAQRASHNVLLGWMWPVVGCSLGPPAARQLHIIVPIWQLRGNGLSTGQIQSREALIHHAWPPDYSDATC